MSAIKSHLLLFGDQVVTETKGKIKFHQCNIHTDNTNLLNSCIHKMSAKLQAVSKTANTACGFDTKKQYEKKP